MKNETHEFKQNFHNLFSANDIWNFVKKGFETIIENNVPTKLTSSKAHQPWITTETKRLIRKKNRWFKKAKTTNSTKDWKEAVFKLV